MLSDQHISRISLINPMMHQRGSDVLHEIKDDYAKGDGNVCY